MTNLQGIRFPYRMYPPRGMREFTLGSGGAFGSAARFLGAGITLSESEVGRVDWIWFAFDANNNSVLDAIKLCKFGPVPVGSTGPVMAVAADFNNAPANQIGDDGGRIFMAAATGGGIFASGTPITVGPLPMVCDLAPNTFNIMASLTNQANSYAAVYWHGWVWDKDSE